MSAGRLEIRLFGSLQVSLGDEPMPRIRNRSVEWLLALLVLRAGQSVSRSWLAGTLWPESREEQALLNLRVGLMRLRDALGEEAARIAAPDRRTLRLDLSGAFADVAAFDAAMRAGDEASLQAAVALYTGPLLEGCYEAWVTLERESREQACLAALETLSERAEERGDYAEAIRHLRRAEAMDPLRDSLSRRLMACLAATGDPAAAIEVYRNLRDG
jgi:DNA-binding SARP family transcriptional activator